MEATPRFRLFRKRSITTDEEAQGVDRRGGDPLARGRRQRPGRGLLPRLFSGNSPRQRIMLLLLVAACGAGPFVSFSLLARVSSSGPDHRDAVVGRSEGEGRQQKRRPSVSLGPDAIPSVVLVERRSPASPTSLSGPARPGGARKGLGHRDGEGGDADAAALWGETGIDRGDPRGCRNTVQGRTLLADSEGRVCRRAERDVHRPGCCAAVSPLSKGGGLRHAAATTTDALASGEGGTGQEILPASSYDGAPAWGERKEGGRRGVRGVTDAVVVSPVTNAGADPGPSRGAEVGFPPEKALSTPFSCWSCDIGEGGSSSSSSSCCRTYEFCVSCCQDPGRDEEREIIVAAAALSGHPAYLQFVRGGNDDVGRHSPDLLLPVPGEEGEGGGEEEGEEREARDVTFDFCAFRCRTHSGSVVHENSFRGPLKHCFGRFRPPTAPQAKVDGAQGNEASEGEGGRGEAVPDTVERSPPLQLDPLIARFMGA